MINNNTIISGKSFMYPPELNYAPIFSAALCLKTESLFQKISKLLSEQQDCTQNTRLYTLSGAAHKLGIGYTSLTNLINEGKIGTITINRNKKISHMEILRFLKEEIMYMHPSLPTQAAYEELIEEKSSSEIFSEEELLNKILLKEN